MQMGKCIIWGKDGVIVPQPHSHSSLILSSLSKLLKHGQTKSRKTPLHLLLILYPFVFTLFINFWYANKHKNTHCKNTINASVKNTVISFYIHQILLWDIQIVNNDSGHLAVQSQKAQKSLNVNHCESFQKAIFHIDDNIRAIIVMTWQTS